MKARGVTALDPFMHLKSCAADAASPYMAAGELLQALAPAGEKQTVESGSKLFSFGEAAKGVYVIVKGTARASLPGEQGREDLLCRMAGPGSVLGLPSAMCAKHYQFDVEALEPVEAFYLPIERVNEILREKPELCMQVMSMMCDELSTLKQTTEHMRHCNKRSCSLHGACAQAKIS